MRRMGVFSGWFEGILLTVAFLAVLTMGIISMNVDYGETHTIPLVDNTTMASIVSYQQASQEQIRGGNVITGGIIGVNIVQSYNLLRGAGDIIWSFLSGGFLNNLGEMLHLGEAGMTFMGVFRIIWVVGLIFGFLYIFFKVII